MCSCCGESIWCTLDVVSVLLCSCCGECIWCTFVVVSVFGVFFCRNLTITESKMKVWRRLNEFKPPVA